MPYVLAFRKSSLLQASGEDAKWDHRFTQTMPTKSGVIGILASCFGLPRGDMQIIDLCKSLKMAVREDKAGTIREDFHTVKPEGDENLMFDGKNVRTIITKRYYLENAAYRVFLSGEKELLEQCANAIYHPVWTPYDGRRVCRITSPMDPVIFESESLRKAVLTKDTDPRHITIYGGKSLRTEIEISSQDEVSENDHIIRRRDQLSGYKNGLYEYDVRLVAASSVSFSDLVTIQ